MAEWLPIQYRDFYDVPRIFLVQRDSNTFLFDCPFNDELDDYVSEYQVYLMPPGFNGDLYVSWHGLADLALQLVGRIPVCSVVFDPSRRKSIQTAVFDTLLAGAGKTRTAGVG